MLTEKSLNATQNDRHKRRAPSIIDGSQFTVDTMKRLSVFVAALLFAVAGCGQSGPLYIADNPSEIYREAPPAAESTADEEQDENGDADKE